mgnify:CR=1 FL=1
MLTNSCAPNLKQRSFFVSDVELEKKLGLTRKTIKSTKEKLKKTGDFYLLKCLLRTHLKILAGI